MSTSPAPQPHVCAVALPLLYGAVLRGAPEPLPTAHYTRTNENGVTIGYKSRPLSKRAIDPMTNGKQGCMSLA